MRIGSNWLPKVQVWPYPEALTEGKIGSTIGSIVARMQHLITLSRGKFAVPLDKDVKDEIRELIATEMKKAVKAAVGAIVNMPTQLVDVQHAMTPEGRQERETRQKVAREIGDAIVKAFEAIEREAQARVVEKTDPARAEVIRNLVLTF